MLDPLAIVLPVTFHEAIRTAGRRKVVLPSTYYGQLQAQARSRAFTISGLAGLTQIASALGSLNEGLRGGMSFSDWKAQALEQEWHLPDSRLELILRMHTQTAYNAGAWERFEDTADARGFLMYDAINDARTRPAHRAMDGIIRPIGDSFWDSHSPPCGYNCRCGLISLTDEQAHDRGGVTVSIPSDAMADPGFGSRPMLGGNAVDAFHALAITVPEPIQQEAMDFQTRYAEERLEQLIANAVQNYPELAAEVEPFLRENQGLIPEWEAVSLREYTRGVTASWNAFLRGQKDLPKQQKAGLVAAVSGLTKFYKYRGEVFRDVDLSSMRDPAAFLAAHQKGAVIQYEGFITGTLKGKFQGNVHYRIRSNTGVLIDSHGLPRAPGGGESQTDDLLFKPGTKFFVLDARQLQNGTIEIDLDELDDQATPIADEGQQFAQNGGEEVHGFDPLRARMAEEAYGVDPDDMRQFKERNGGLTPLQAALELFPATASEIYELAPHLAPK
jgi:SPP1 gp7 family putative phage head morphogenesis protein